MIKLKRTIKQAMAKLHKRSAINPADLLREQITVQVSEAGQLPNRIGAAKKDYIQSLKVVGNLNGTDIKLLRKLENIALLDLAEANILTGGSYYIDTLYATTESNTIGQYMFHNSKTLVLVNIPNTTEKIAPSAFANCEALEEIDLGQSLTEIQEGAFYHCAALEKVHAPKNTLQTIGIHAFEGCKSLESISFEEGLRNIGESAFADCHSLSVVKLPSTLEVIGDSAFAKTALDTIVIPRSVRKIGSLVFDGCSSLTSIYVEASHLPEVKENAFQGVNKKRCTLYVPKGMKQEYWLSRGWDAFEHIEEF